MIEWTALVYVLGFGVTLWTIMFWKPLTGPGKTLGAAAAWPLFWASHVLAHIGGMK